VLAQPLPSLSITTTNIYLRLVLQQTASTTKLFSIDTHATRCSFNLSAGNAAALLSLSSFIFTIMRYITPSSPLVVQSSDTNVTDTHHKLSQNTASGDNSSEENTLSTNTTATAATLRTTTEFFILPKNKRTISTMIVVSFLLPLVGMYGMILLHPWIDWFMMRGMYLSAASSSVSPSNANDAAHHVMTNDDNDDVFNSMVLAEKNETLKHLVMSSLSMKKQQEQEEVEEESGPFIDLPSFVEEEQHERGEVTPRPMDRNDNHDIVNDDGGGDKVDGVEEEKTSREEEEKEVSTLLLNESTDADASSNIICVNCHALFRIHVDVTFQDVDSMLSTATSQQQQQNQMNWFIMLRDVTYYDSSDPQKQQLVYVQQMDQPLHLDCSSDHSILPTCQSIAILEVPYTSFSSTSTTGGYNSTNYHEVTNERIILVSLQREWSESNNNGGGSTQVYDDVMMVKKKRRIVDQWMINIVVPSTNNKDGGGARYVSSIYTAKLRDVIKVDSSKASSSAAAEGRKELGSHSSNDEKHSLSSSSMHEVIIACFVGVVCGSAILAIAFIFVVPRQEDDKEEEDEEEEELMTTPGILALQRAIRGSNSDARNDEEVELTIRYESVEGRSAPMEEECEARLSTPTNLSPLFDDEADSHDDGVKGSEVAVENTFLVQVDGSEEVEESRSEDDEGSEVEGSVQEQFEDDEHSSVEGDAAVDMIDEDEETPPTSNRSNRWSGAPRRNSLDNVDDIIQEQTKPTAMSSSSPIFYSPKFQTDETVPLPHSNTSSVYDQVEHADDVNSKPTTSVELATMNFSNPSDTNQPAVERRAEWSEFGAFSQDCEVLSAAEDGENENTNDNEVAAYAATNKGDNAVKTELDELDESMFLPNVNAQAETNAEEDNPSLSDVSKRLFATSKETTDEAVKASSFQEDVEEVDESMFLPNVNVQAEANASPFNLQVQKNVRVEAIASPPELYRATMTSNAKNTQTLNPQNKPAALCDALAPSMTQCDVDDVAEGGGSPPVEPLAGSHQTAAHTPASPAENTVVAHATAACNKSIPMSSPSNSTYKAPKKINTPPTAPMTSYKDDYSPSSSDMSAEKFVAKCEAFVAKCDVNESPTVTKVASGSLEKTALSTAAQNLPTSPSPNGSHDLSYVNQSLSVSSSPSVTSAPRNSNSPSVTSDPRFSPGDWSNSRDGSDIEGRQRKRRSLPFVSREETSRADGKENASSNSRTPLPAKATSYSPSSTVAATVAEFAVPRTSNGLAWRSERPVPIPTGNAGQNKRLGGSPTHFEPQGASQGVESNDESIDFMNGADFSSQNDSSQHNGSSRSGKRSRTSKGSKGNKKTSRKRKNVEKKLLATTKTSDKHKPPSWLGRLSQSLNDDMWQHSQSSNKS
jgi:hypothetical protein